VNKMEGIIKFYNSRKGFGFIERLGNNKTVVDVFFHVKDIFDDPACLFEGVSVVFNIEIVDGKQRAINIMRTNKDYLKECGV